MHQQFQDGAYQHGVQGVGSSNLLAPTNEINDLQYHTVSKRSTVYKPKANIFAAFFLLIITLLTGCGGGSGGSSAPQEAAPDDVSYTGVFKSSNNGVAPVMHQAIYAGAKSVVFDGDSLTYLWDYTNWPTKVMNDSTWTNTVWNDTGIGGTTTVDMVARYDADVHPLGPDVAGNGIYILNGGTGDLCNRVGTDVSAYANLKTLWAKARADGFKVVATTIHASCGVAGSKWEKYRKNLNALIRSDPSLYDALAPNDITIPNIYDASMLIDTLHYAAGGNAAVAYSVESVIAGM